MLLAVLIFAAIKSNAQVDLINHLKQHIYTLAADSLDGRCAGTEGEKKAQHYIINQLKEIGVAPKGEGGFLQPFEFNSGIKYTGDCKLEIDRGSFKQDEDFFPLTYRNSSRCKIYWLRN
ncbi:MAG: hypothetical protein WCJ33_06550 [Pseudomonadota bacterium]